MRIHKFLHRPKQLAHTRFELPVAKKKIHFLHKSREALSAQVKLALTGFFPLPSETNSEKSVPQSISYYNPLWNVDV
jgi:hypothetical protein